VRLDRQEHDKILDLLFKFFTSTCLRIMPDLFLRDMYRTLSVPRSQTLPKAPHYSPMLHNALIALATAFSDDPYVHDSKSRQYFVTAARSYLDSECSSPNISVIQALALLGNFHCGQGEETLGYTYFGLSSHIIQSLGLRIDCSPRVKRRQNLISHDDMLVRNWAHWTTFCLDVCWSLYGGYGFSVSPSGIPVPLLDPDLDQTPWYYPPSGIPAQPGYLFRTFAETCKLLRIARRLVRVVNRSSVTTDWEAQQLIGRIDSKLRHWKSRIPPEVEFLLKSI